MQRERGDSVADSGGLTHRCSGEGDKGSSEEGSSGKTMMVLEDTSNTLEITPLAIDFSMQEEEFASSGVLENSSTVPQQPSDWVMEHMKKIGKVLGASYEGNEEFVMGLLQNIEARRTPKSHSESLINRRGRLTTKGLRELRGLISTVNYEPRTIENRRSSRERALIVSQ